MRRTEFFLIPILLIALAGPAWAKTRVVPRDYPTIQGAVDASSDGDKVIVKQGPYNENVIIRNRTDFKIKCENKPIMDLEGEGTALTIINCTNLKVRNFRIHNAGEDGILVLDSVNVQLRNIRIKDCGGTGIEIRAGRTFDIYRAKIENCGEHGIYLGANGGEQYSRRANVEKCQIYGAKGYGVHIDGKEYHSVRKNRIYECGWGVFISINAESSRADRNRIEDCVGGGVSVGGLSNFARWNRIKRTGGDALQVLGIDSWVQGNHAKQTGGRAFVLAGQGCMFRNNHSNQCGGDGMSILGIDLIVRKSRIQTPGGRGLVVTTGGTAFRSIAIKKAGTIGMEVLEGAVGNLFQQVTTKNSGETGLVDPNEPGSNEYRKSSFK